MTAMTGTMPGVVLPGNSTVEFRDYPVPEPGHGQVLVRMKASSICGSDIRAIYREHLGQGPERYQGVINVVATRIEELPLAAGDLVRSRDFH